MKLRLLISAAALAAMTVTAYAAGVDMTTAAPVESTLDLFERRVSELEELLLR